MSSLSPSHHMRRMGRALHLAYVVGTALGDGLVRSMHKRSPHERARWLQHQCRRGLRALGVRLDVKGAPSPGAFVASNHLGYLDVLVLAAGTPVVFVAKREVATWPVWGRLATMAGTVFIDRTRRSDVARAARDMAALLEQGVGVALFPEGTSSDGARVLPFKSALLEPVVALGAAAVPVALAYGVPGPYRTEHDVCWWGNMTLLPHLWRLLGISEIEAFASWGDPLGRCDDRKQLAAALRVAVEQQHRTAPAGAHRSGSRAAMGNGSTASNRSGEEAVRGYT